MDKPEPAGPVLAIDHDRLFKELLTTFFAEFLELFFPKLAATLDRDSIEFLSQEHFADSLDGAVYHADLVVKAKFRGKDAYFLIHVEHQSTAPGDFPRRFFRYFSAIHEKHGLPVYPIVIYSHERPQKEQPDEYRIDFADGEVLRFRYRVVQLNRLDWRSYVDKANPVASALMAKMKIAEGDRARVKVECLRLMVTLKLDRARMRLIAGFVDAYLNLNPAEEGQFQAALEGTALEPKEREEVMEMMTSWERRGMERGRTEGRMEGHLEALRSVLMDVLATRFGSIDDAVTARIQRIDSIDELRALTHRGLTASSLAEVGV